MKKSIETIWKEGFLKEDELLAPRLNDLYNQKSKNLVERLLYEMEKGMWIIVPLSLMMIVVNSLAGNDFFWGILTAIIMLPWFFVGRKQLNSIKEINYNNSCYEYLKSINTKIKKIARFNQKLSLYYILSILLPMLIYTYFNNPNKTFGEIFGIEKWNGSSLLIFLFLPLVLILFYIISEIIIKRSMNKNKIEVLLRDMEELRGKS